MGKEFQKFLLFIKNIPQGWFDAFQHYFDFKGRTNRAGFWSFVIMNSLFAFIILFLSYRFSLIYRVQIFTKCLNVYLFFTAYVLLSVIPFCFLCIRRLHDLNFRGFWMLVWFFCFFITIPYMYTNFICQLLLFVIVSFSSDEKNRFGDKPEKTFSI